MKDVDTGFIGVNNLVDPSLIKSGHAFYDLNEQTAQPGLVSDAINNRFEGGTARTRKGSWQPRGLNPAGVTVANPLIAAATWFVAGASLLMLATTSACHLVGEGRTPQVVPYAPGVTAPRGSFTPCFGRALLWRGGSQNPLHWSGRQGDVFDVAATSPVVDPPPMGSWGIVAAGRVWTAIGPTVYWSDIYNELAWDLIRENARVDAGTGEAVVALTALSNEKILVLKERSLGVLSNIVGGGTGLSGQMRFDPVTSELGCVARDSVCTVGGSTFWLADGGLYRLSEVLKDSLEAAPVPLSAQVQRWFDRINWAAAGGATVQLVGKYLYLAVPMDGASVNNAVLVYDVHTQQWQGIDIYGPTSKAETATLRDEREFSMSSPGSFVYGRSSRAVDRRALQPLQLMRLPYGGRTVPVLIDATSVTLLEQGLVDRTLAGIEYPIRWEVTTRGYMLGSLSPKRPLTAGIAVATLGASLSIEALTDGPEERQPLATKVTRDRWRYDAHGVPDFNGSNASGRFNEPRRQDYSAYVGDGLRVGTAGLLLNEFQEWPCEYPIRQGGRWVSLRLVSEEGAVIFRSVEVEGTAPKNAKAGQTQ
jgi:hypothetical protein